MNAIDTNVLVYAYDEQHGAKQCRAIGLIDDLARDPLSTILLWQVAREFIAVLRRWQANGRLSSPDFDAYCADMLGYFPLVCPSASVIPRALGIASRYRLSHWDSLLIAAALEVGVDTLYTEDLQGAAIYDGLRIVNPFA